MLKIIRDMFNLLTKKQDSPKAAEKSKSAVILEEMYKELNEFRRLSEKYGTIVKTSGGHHQLRTSVKSFGKNPKKGRNII